MTEVAWRAGDLYISLKRTARGEGFHQIIFTASRSGFTAAREAFIDDDDLGSFTEGIDRMSTVLSGTAELLGDYGTKFILRLTMLSAGHVKVHVEVKHTFATLCLEDEIDQTYLPGLRYSLLCLT